jgi:hypothetical protein
MSVREDICDNIVSTLKGVLDPVRIKFVTRNPFKFEELSSAQFPACLVQTAGERRSDRTIGASDIQRQSELTVRVFGFVKGANIDSQRNELIEAIENGLDADRTRGGYALDTQVVEVETDEGAIEPYGGVVVTVTVLYTFARGNA